MRPHFNSPGSNSATPPIVDRTTLKTCHIRLPDVSKPVAAIVHNQGLYSFVKLYPTLEAATLASRRLLSRGNPVVLTQVPKGWVVWVLEPDAQFVR